MQSAVLGLKEFRARVLQRSPYIREVLTLREGACIALDWVISSQDGAGEKQQEIANEAPVCVLLHGSFQDSSSVTMSDLACSLAVGGMPVVVMNRRGYAGLSLSGPPESRRMALYGFDEDLDDVLEVVGKRFPRRHVAIVGFSCGAGFACRYVGNRKHLSAWAGQNAATPGPLPQIVCAVLLDSGYDVSEVVKNVPAPMSWILNNCLKYYYGFRHRGSFQEAPPSVSKSHTDILSLRNGLLETYALLQGLSGANSREAWVDLQQGRLHDIELPSLLINSRDDPIAVWANVEAHQEQIASNPNLALAEFRCGAHNCKYDFWGVSSVADGMIRQFILSASLELQTREDSARGA